MKEAIYVFIIYYYARKPRRVRPDRKAKKNMNALLVKVYLYEVRCLIVSVSAQRQLTISLTIL